jgi:hypothetical protein
MKVGLFIVGAPKAGTTSLYHYLSEHPEVFMSREKETDFFSSEELKGLSFYYKSKSVPSLEAYKLQFEGATDAKILGEGSVSYLYYPKVPVKIKEYNPSSKIIIMLRHPVDRAYSHYLMDYGLGLIDVSFEEVMNRKGIEANKVFYQQCIELGFYYAQVKRYLDIFGASNVHLIEYESFKRNTSEEMQKVFEFIDIDLGFSPNINKVHNRFSMPNNSYLRKLYAQVWLRKALAFVLPNNAIEKVKGVFFKQGKPKLSSASRKQLLEIYAEDISKLEKMLNLDLLEWRK